MYDMFMYNYGLQILSSVTAAGKNTMKIEMLEMF